jgi:hypothetical protein
MKKHWYLWVFLTAGLLIIAGGVYYLLPKPDNPKYQQAEITALVKSKLVELGIAGHKIESVDSVAAPQYLGDGRWSGSANVSYSYLSSSPGMTPKYYNEYNNNVSSTHTETTSISWVYYERLNVVEITN